MCNIKNTTVQTEFLWSRSVLFWGTLWQMTLCTTPLAQEKESPGLFNNFLSKIKHGFCPRCPLLTLGCTGCAAVSSCLCSPGSRVLSCRSSIMFTQQEQRPIGPMVMPPKLPVSGYCHVKEIHFLIRRVTRSTANAALTLPVCLSESCPSPPLQRQFRLKIQPSSADTPKFSEPLVGARTAGQDATLFPWDRALCPLPKEAGGCPQTTNPLQSVFVVLSYPRALTSPAGDATSFGSAGKSRIWGVCAQQKRAHTMRRKREQGWCTERGIRQLSSLQVTGHRDFR